MDENYSPQPKPTLRERFNKFFFNEEVPYGMALMRICLCTVLLGVTVYRWPHVRELFSADGATAPLSLTFGFGRMLPELPGTACVALYSAMIGFFIASIVGWQTRFSLFAANILFAYFTLLDAISTITKYTVISNHLLLLLAVSNCGSLWSVDAWLKQRNRKNFMPGEPSKDREKFPIWPQRLAQLFIGIVYLGAAATKLHTPTYFTGDQLKFWMVTNMNYSNPVGDFLSLFPIILVVMAYIALTWEILFVFTVWSGWTRLFMLGLGLFFHFMTTVTLGLYVFPMVCYSAYLAFIRTDDVQWMTRIWRRAARRWHWLNWRLPDLPKVSALESIRTASPYLFTAAVLFIALTGAQAEHWLDPYGIRRPEGPYALQPMDQEHAETMLTTTAPLRPKDQVFSFDVGRMIAGQTVINSTPEFRQGQRIYAQASLIPPHGDLYMECNLHDANGAIIEEVGQIVPREWTKVNFNYLIDHRLEPGEYDLVLKANAEEVDRRRITLKTKSQGLWSN